jgi:hypothetical protein
MGAEIRLWYDANDEDSIFPTCKYIVWACSTLKSGIYLVLYLEAEKRSDRRNFKLTEDGSNASDEGGESAKEATEITTNEPKDSVEQVDNGLTVTRRVSINASLVNTLKVNIHEGI